MSKLKTGFLAGWLALFIVFTIGPVTDASAQDLVGLTDSTMAVVRDIPLADLELELDAITTLLTSYERNKREADHHRVLIVALIKKTKSEIKEAKAEAKIAKNEARLDDRDELVASQKTLESKKKYLERAVKVREAERNHAAALVEWTKRVRTYYEKAMQLMEERQRNGRDHDLLTLEKEMIEEQKQAAGSLKKVGSEMSKLAARRKSMYRAREKLLAGK